MKLYTIFSIILTILNLICLLVFLLWFHLWRQTADSNNEEIILEEWTGLGAKVDEQDRHPCYWNRKCSTDPQTRRICGYNFTTVHNFVLSKYCRQCPKESRHCSLQGCIPADGRYRPLSVVNHMLPGPAIRVCEGDRVIVDVTNHLIGQATAIHWHGIHQQNTSWMDGVPLLSQCPIHPGSAFRYEFDTPNPGTNYWHSHEGFQRADGIFGNLIVRPAAEKKVESKYLYDFDLAEHELIIWDWLPQLTLNRFVRGLNLNERDFPENILVNGKGFPYGFFKNFRSHETLKSKGKEFVPIHEVRIKQNFSYRIRLISNGIGECPIEVSIENHILEVIASDGFDLTPVIVESLVIYAGERWDFIVRGNQDPSSYWIKFRGLLDCDGTQKGAFQLAVLNYEQIPSGTLPSKLITTWADSAPSRNIQNGSQLNSVNIAPGIENQYLTAAEISSAPNSDDDPEILTADPQHQFYISYDFNPVPDKQFSNLLTKDNDFEKNQSATFDTRLVVEPIVNFPPQLNYISNKMPHAPPLSQPELVDSITKCSDARMKTDVGVKNCTKEFCHCSHWLKVDLNSIVEIILIDRGAFETAHPFHIHGHSFRVVAMERLGNRTRTSTVRKRDENKLIQRRRSNAPIKDSVTVPDGGFTILRFRATNPGFWLFHCHVIFHSEEGMGLILQVGEIAEMPRPPKDFPMCSNYVPATNQSLRSINVL